MRLGRITHGPLFDAIARRKRRRLRRALTDKHVARLVQKRALKAGIRGELTEGERKRAFGGHSCGPGSPPRRKSRRRMCKTPRPRQRRDDPEIQRKRDQFKVNLTKAAGL